MVNVSRTVRVGGTRDGEAWVHHGGNFVPYKPPAKGTYTFTVHSFSPTGN